jgi:glyoxylase-like metal-dependent hydrolase (beta-lactamase superfamily II)
MKKIASCALLSAVSLAAHAASMSPVDRVAQAIEAMGGKGLRQLRTLTVKAHTRHWEPEQSYQAGAEMRFAGDSTFAQSRDLASGAVRTDWVRDLVYPGPRQFKFAEVVAGGIGYVDGIDSNSRTKQSLDSDPPRHAMSGIRVAAAVREIARASPTLLLEMARDPGRVELIADQDAGGRRLPAVRCQAEGTAFLVLFDPATGLPERIRTRDYDTIQGDSDYDLVLSDWRATGGIQYPFRQLHQLNGRTVVETGVDQVAVNPVLDPSLFAIPEALRAGAPKRATGYVPYQWVIRRQFIGVFLDSDGVAYDAQARSGLELVDLAPGVTYVAGGTHNSLIVELDGYLVGFDAPVGEARSKWTIEQAARKYPGKPFKYLVLTHHHVDHAGGVRTYAAAGATVVVGPGNGTHFRKVLASPDSLGADSPKKTFTPSIIEADHWSVTDGKREAAAYLVEDPHAAGMLIGYVPGARLGFVADLWSPGPPLPPRASPPLMAVVAAVRRWNLQPERFLGGHGGLGSYPELLKTASVGP